MRRRGRRERQDQDMGRKTHEGWHASHCSGRRTGLRGVAMLEGRGSWQGVERYGEGGLSSKDDKKVKSKCRSF